MLPKGFAGGFQEKLGHLRPDRGPRWPYSGLGSVLEGLKSRLSWLRRVERQIGRSRRDVKWALRHPNDFKYPFKRFIVKVGAKVPQSL